MNSHTSTILPLVCAMLVAPLCLAGDLNPPAGPIDSTMKTLGQIEPRIPIGPDTTPGDASSTYIISAPGSYYLTENLIGEPFKEGITITASDVSIDLMGFTLSGGADARYAIIVPGAAPSRITIRNGFINDWDLSGVYIGGILGLNKACVIENLIISACDSYGIQANDHSIVRNCTVSNCGVGISVGQAGRIESCTAINNNTGRGFDTGQLCVIENCISHANATSGYRVSPRSVVRASIASNNTTTGFLGSDSSFTECVANNNTSNGFGVSDTVSIIGCTILNNDANGIDADVSPGVDPGVGSTIKGNVCVNNDLAGITGGSGHQIAGNVCYINDTQGINVADNCLIDANLSSTNGSATATHGILALNSNRITNNHVVSSAGGGIIADLDNTIERNSVAYSATTGISVDDRNRIVGNNSHNNPSRGIYTSARECTIHNNRIANNGLRGIDCNGDRNFVFANFARNNGGINYEAPANNRFGPIVVPPLSGVILGSTDPDTLGAGTTDPFANFTY